MEIIRKERSKVAFACAESVNSYILVLGTFREHILNY